MAKQVELIFISSSLVCSSSPASFSKLELNSWDLRALKIVPIQRALIFPNPLAQPKQFLIQALKTSLSRALHFFPPLAGRLTSTAHGGDMASFLLDCNNAGADFTHAVASAVSISDIIHPTYIPEIVSLLFPSSVAVTNYAGIAKPLLAVQVTELADGIFIAFSANHAVVDGNSFWHFVKSWSEISRGAESISKSPVFNLAAGDDTLIHLPTLEKNLVSPSQSPQRVFNFSREKLDRLKEKANSEAGTDKISTLQALMAHLWRSTVRSQNTNGSSSCVLVIAIGARARMRSSPDAYFGNASYAATLAISASDLLEGGLGGAAVKINELISEQGDETARRAAEEEVRFDEVGRKGSGPPPLIIGSSPRHDVYGCDFGWGKPVGVRSGKVHKVEGLVFVFPAAEGGGIDLEVCLAEETLRAMEIDAEFVTV